MDTDNETYCHATSGVEEATLRLWGAGTWGKSGKEVWYLRLAREKWGREFTGRVGAEGQAWPGCSQHFR